MDGVVKQEWGCLSVHLEDFTFFRVKSHQPVFFPHLKVIQIGLQLGTAILRVGCQAQDSIVCEQVDFKNKDLREAFKLQFYSNLLRSIRIHNDDDNN